MRWFIRLSSLDPKNILPISFSHKKTTKKLENPDYIERKDEKWFDWWEKLHPKLDRGKTKKKNSSNFSTRPFRNPFSSKFPQKSFSRSIQKLTRKLWKCFLPGKDNLRIKKCCSKYYFFMFHQFPLRFWGEPFSFKAHHFFLFQNFLSLCFCCYFFLFESSLKDFEE
jgi:hypothetical protein